MEFLIPATETFMDLNRSYFEMEVQFKTSAPANTAYNTVMYPVTNLAHSMIKQLSVHANDVLLEPQTDHYHYKASFQTVSPSESRPRSIVRHGDVTVKNMLFDLCFCVGSVAQRDKASDYESEESRFESWQSLFFSV